MVPRPSAGDRGATSPAVLVLVLVAVAGLVVGGAAVMAAQAQPTGDEILDRVQTTYENAETVTGSATVTVENESATETADVEFAAADPNLTRIAVTKNDRTVVVGTNGTVAWAYDETTGMLRTWTEDDRERMESRFDASDAAHPWNSSAEWNHTPTEDESAYTAVREGTETVNGIETTVVRVEPTNDSLDVTGTLWVDPEDWTVVKQRVTDGTNETVVTYRDVQFNVSIHESTFEPPTERTPGSTGFGATSYDTFESLQSNTSLDLPVLTASGYAFERGAVRAVGDDVTVAQEYTNGSETVVLVASTRMELPEEAGNGTSVTVDGTAATLGTVRGQTVVWWQRGDLTYAVFADGSDDRVRRLAESVE